MKRWIVLTIAVVALITGLGAWRMRRFSARPEGTKENPPVGSIYKVAANLYVVPGGGGNTAVFVTANGVVLVDTKYSDRYAALLKEVRTVTDKPIRYVINTHCHGDHMGGNVLLPEGTEIVVQEKTARNMEEMRRSWDPDNLRGRPLRTFKDKLTLFSGEDAVDLYYFGPAHTDGDTFVVFRAAQVMHAGDVFSDKASPIINTKWGGNGKTYGEVIGRVVSNVRGVRLVISGHGPVYGWADFADYGEFNRILLEHAQAVGRFFRRPRLAAAMFRLPAKFKNYSLDRLKFTIDEIYNSTDN